MAFDTINLLMDLISTELDMPEGRCALYNQRRILQQTDDMFITLQFLTSKVFANDVKYYRHSTTGQEMEYQSSCIKESYQIDVFSRTQEALRRKHEVLFALRGTRSIQLQEKYGFQIPPITTSFIDVSAIEGTARLNRYALRMNVLRAYDKTKPVDYYSTFNPTEVTNNQ